LTPVKGLYNMTIDRRYVKNVVEEKRVLYKKLEVDTGEVLGALESTAVDTIAELTEALVESANSSLISYDILAEGMFKGIQKQHNFLQGEFWIAMEKTIRKYSEMEYVDGRNAFAKDMCGAFVKGNDERTT